MYGRSFILHVAEDLNTEPKKCEKYKTVFFADAVTGASQIADATQREDWLR